MIKSIQKMDNLGVFKSFDWDSTVQDSDNRPVYFKPLNIIYGRNYSGKTTFSRVIRALQKGRLPERFDNATFNVEFADGSIVDQETLTGHNHTIRVFNEDFVRDNLGVFYDEDENVTAFAVLGEANTDIAAQLEVTERELGSEDSPGTVAGVMAARQKELGEAKNAHNTAQRKLDNQLKDKATDRQTGIKYQSIFGVPSYDIRKIKKDIETTSGEDYLPLDEKQIEQYKAVLEEMPRPVPAIIPIPQPKDGSLHKAASELLTRKITANEPIRELLDDAALQMWVERGRELHEGSRTHCGFCGAALPQDLWDRLDRHFSQESKALRAEIRNLLAEIDTELGRLSGLLPIDPNAFYFEQVESATEMKETAQAATAVYEAELRELKALLKQRDGDVFTAIPAPGGKETGTALVGIAKQYEALRQKAALYKSSLEDKQDEAREKLRLHEVWRFAADIHYADQKRDIEQLATDAGEAETKVKKARRDVERAETAIADLKNRMRDERNGAAKVNQYLRHYFGHPSLSLEVVPGEDDGSAQFRFEIRRDGQKAYHLSEGERGLLAFCYFMGRLEDVDTVGTKPIVWIDDPISSLDDNHIFFIYSLMRSRLIETELHGQLFVSTHSLSFLKYLLRITGSRDMNRQYFIIHRKGTRSTIQKMPKHIKQFATEFHYLFHQVYRCAKTDDTNERSVDAFYSFGNNIRKFLEMYLYFRYPNGDSTKSAGPNRLRRFLGEDAVSAALAERVENEYSHLEGIFERGLLPIVDIATMKAMAQLVLDKIWEHDKEQYESLLASVGETSPDEHGDATADVDS